MIIKLTKEQMLKLLDNADNEEIELTEEQLTEIRGNIPFDFISIKKTIQIGVDSHDPATTAAQASISKTMILFNEHSHYQY